MNVLSADKVSKAYSEKWLFKEITFGITKGEKIALVGANGTGKSTLLKTIAGLIIPDSGEIKTANLHTVGYLSQEPTLNPNLTIEQTLFNFDNEISKTIALYEKAAANIDNNIADFNFYLEEMNRLDAWDYEKKVKQILAKLGIKDLSLSISNLSGGQLKRVALAQLLITQPDILIIDEPTNHLDLVAIEWLETTLNNHQTTLLMVTHDRYFLDNVCTKIFELDKGNLYIHNGKYNQYLESKALRKDILNAEVSKAKNLLTKELEWMRRMPKARGTKSKSRIENFYELEEKANQNLSDSALEISVQATRLGNKIIELHNISKYYDKKILINSFSYLFKKHDRIGLIGQNGVGKSTLLDIITQIIPPDAGTVTYGSTLKIGYYTQHTSNLNTQNKIIEEVKEIAEYVTLGDGKQITVSKLLDMFLFPPAFQQTPIHKLSGGERRRLQLLKVLVTNPNFLILDEPTNDLDIDTLNILEDFLAHFKGCLLLVSHDRYFIDNLVDHLFVFEDNGFIRDFHGNYTDYIQWKTEQTTTFTKEVIAKKEKPTTTPKTKQKLSFKEQQELEQLGKELEKLETEKMLLTEKLSIGSTNPNEITEWALQLEDTNNQIDEKSMRWLTLSEFI